MLIPLHPLDSSEIPTPAWKARVGLIFREGRYRAVASLKLSTHIDWSTGEPTPM
jgi:hypothetical protein